MCLEGYHDFENDMDCSLFLDLLRMVKHEGNFTSWWDNRDYDLEGAYMTEETKQDVIELLQEFKDVYAWSYQDMPRLGTDIVIWAIAQR